MAKVAVVTGGSSGIGLCTAISLAEAGCKVYTISRREFFHDRLTHIAADITEEASVMSAVSHVVEKEQHIDILVNCAGFGISGAVEFTPIKDIKRQMDVNFFGLAAVTKAVLPHMRRQGSGRIINISSVAAPVAIPFQSYYSASKAAINSFTCALANEVRPFGITVTAVQPGDISTGFTEARNKESAGDREYSGRISKSVSKMEKDERKGMKPEIAGKYIAAIAVKRRVKPLYTIGFFYKLVCLLCKILPCGVLNRMIGLLYAE